MIWLIFGTVLLLVMAGVVLFLKSTRKVESKEAQDTVRWSIGMVVGGIAGMVIGIMLVEFAGYTYELPFILWLLGMAAGQIGGILYNRYKK